MGDIYQNNLYTNKQSLILMFCPHPSTGIPKARVYNVDMHIWEGRKQMVLYADVLLAINYIISHLMLICTQRLSGIPLSPKGGVLGSLWGGICALSIFLPPQGGAMSIAIRIITVCGMLLLAYRGRSVREYLRLCIILMLVSFVFAGLVFGLCLILPGGPVSYTSGVVYLNISPFVLLLTTGVAYLFLGVVRRIYGNIKQEKSLHMATISRDGVEVELQLFCDTGNNLQEPFSGKSVVVCSLKALLPLLSMEEAALCSDIGSHTEIPKGLRLVPYNAVGGSGLLIAFEPDSFFIFIGERRLDFSVFIGINPVDMTGCDGVFSPSLIEMRV